MASRQQEEQVQSIEKYGVHLFYGGSAELSTQRYSGNFGATYSDGQFRPVVTAFHGAAPSAAKPPTAARAPGVGNPRNENWQQDQVVFSQESRDLRSAASWSAGSPARLVATPSGDSRGPAYCGELRRSLDALLNGLG